MSSKRILREVASPEGSITAHKAQKAYEGEFLSRQGWRSVLRYTDDSEVIEVSEAS